MNYIRWLGKGKKVMFLVLYTKDWLDQYKSFDSREKAKEFANSLENDNWQIVQVI